MVVRKQLNYLSKYINKMMLYLSFGEMGHHALAGSTSLSHSAMEELWLNGWMEERVCGWLERQRVSKHPLGQHNSMQGRIVLRVAPTPLFIAFFGIFRVLTPWLGL